MRYLKTTSIEPVVDHLVGAISSQLAAAKTVLWLVPGGSVIAVAVEVSERLAAIDMANLYVSLTDERYGPVGHADSNWLQLAAAGFSLPRAHLLPVLTGTDRAATATAYSRHLKDQLATAGFKIGLFGLGSDGHTAGILPHSPAVRSQGYAEAYDANFERITMTPRAIKRLDEAIVYAIGGDKAHALDMLDKDVPLEEQPGQVLKEVPEITIYNDHKGDQV